MILPERVIHPFFNEISQPKFSQIKEYLTWLSLYFDLGAGEIVSDLDANGEFGIFRSIEVDTRGFEIANSTYNEISLKLQNVIILLNYLLEFQKSDPFFNICLKDALDMIMGIVFNDGILFHPKTREDIIKTIGEIANLAF